jgi:hypothetical protein
MTNSSIMQELARGEKLLWSGGPRQGIVLRGSDVFFIPFSLLWGGFAIFWETMVLRNGAPFFFTLWGIPFVLAGLYITVGRFFYDAWRRGRTQYGVTNERVVIVTGGMSPSTKSLNLRTLTDVTLDAKSDGSGTITFGPTSFTASMYAGTAWPGVKLPPSFELISDARRVYEIIRQAQKETPAGSAA